MENQIIFEGRRYYMDDCQKWYDADTFMAVQESLAQKLNEKISINLALEDQKISDFDECIHKASKARFVENYERAARLAMRAIEIKPHNHCAVSLMSSILRAQKKPQEALDLTEPFSRNSDSVIKTTRAAALCDLGRWEDAKKEIGVALAINQSEEAFNVVKRIKANRPQLYDKDIA